MTLKVADLRRDLEEAEVRARGLRAVSEYRRLPKGLRDLAQWQARGFEGIARVLRRQISGR